MADTTLGVAWLVVGLVVLCLLDCMIVTGCVWAAARIFRYKKRDWKTPMQIALYSLKFGAVAAAPFVAALYFFHPSLEELFSKGPRLLLPVGLVFIVKTAAIFPEMKNSYEEGIKKTVNGYATAVYLMVVAWILVVVEASMLIGLYGLLSIAMGGSGAEDEAALTGWWDLQPDDYGEYNATSKAFSVPYVNDAGEPIKIDAAEAIDIGSETECIVASPVQSQVVDRGGLFAFNATCPGSATQGGERYGMFVQIYYTTVNNPLAPKFENGYFSGNATA